jgi:hypothetical protein
LRVAPYAALARPSVGEAIRVSERCAVSIRTAHKILITTAIVFFLFYAIWEIRNYPDPGGMWALLRGIISGIAACGLGIYLRYFLKSLKLR